jgi:hypothetical protein
MTPPLPNCPTLTRGGHARGGSCRPKLPSAVCFVIAGSDQSILMTRVTLEVIVCSPEATGTLSSRAIEA